MFTLDYRPRLLSQIRGQKYIVREFKKRFNKNKIDIPQVMLFESASGLGKTSMALIIASTLNCRNPKINEEGYLEPCLECPSCRNIIEEKFSGDVVQIDCTKSNKEDIVDIESIANSSPIFGKNRIIIIEEFGTLVSTKAKEAVLKLIEKPRKNVYFIFTSMTKIDKSISSRCSTSYFKVLSKEELLDFVCDFLIESKLNEKIPDTFISEVVPSIIFNFGTSVRDVLQNLESAIMKECWTEISLCEALNILSENTIDNILEGLLNKKSNALIELKNLTDKKEFFNITRSLLTNACIYKINTNISDDKKNWMIEKYIKLSKFENLISLLEVYENSESGFYFSETKFLIELVKYFLKATEVTQSSLIRVPKK